jgi:hypothetical protein
MSTPYLGTARPRQTAFASHELDNLEARNIHTTLGTYKAWVALVLRSILSWLSWCGPFPSMQRHDIDDLQLVLSSVVSHQLYSFISIEIVFKPFVRLLKWKSWPQSRPFAHTCIAHVRSFLVEDRSTKETGSCRSYNGWKATNSYWQRRWMTRDMWPGCPIKGL